MTAEPLPVGAATPEPIAAEPPARGSDEVRAAGRLDGRRPQGVRRPSPVGPFHRPAHRPWARGRDPAVLRRRRDPLGRVVGQRRSAIFIALFWLAPSVTASVQLPSVAGFLAIVAPLLGLAFAFDAVNGERAQGTLPRLLSQPIHRDDVINGKFAAGLAVIAIVLVAVIGFIAGVSASGRIGIVPAPSELLRIILWVFVTFAYVSLWLAFGMLLSVLVRRAATSALIGFGTWLLLSIFGGLITTLIGGFVAPLTGTAEQVLVEQPASRRRSSGFRPDILYSEASRALLSPQVTDVGHTRDGRRLRAGAAADPVAAVTRPELHPRLAAGCRARGITVACFAIAYVRFMRQEVRA